MAKSIEILENTLLKLLVRSGSDSDRKTVILDSAELGYTTDTKRLYIGDGSTYGGILVGNVFKGSGNDVTALGNSTIGDLAFDTDNKVLYQLKYSAYNNLSSWEQIGGVYSAADGTIKVSSTNTVSVCAISAYNISSNALGKSLTLDTGKVTLSSTVSIDKIVPNTSTYFTLPSALSINTLNYTFPSTPLSANTFLSTSSAGNLSWVNVNTLVSSVTAVGFASASNTITVGTGLTAIADGVLSSTFKLSSSNVQIGGLFLPKAHATFDQTGAVTRSVGVVSVSAVNFAYVFNEVPSLFGFDIRQTDSNLDYRGAAGYLITTTDTLNSVSTVVDVVAKNAAHSWTNNFYKYGEDPTLKPFYKIVGLNQILAFFYTIPIGAYGQPQGPVVTPGYANITYTRFSVTVY